jgi:uncharacterized protein
MTQVSYALTLFFSSFLESLPFLLLGVGVSSGLLVFLDENQWRSRFPKNPILGSFFGSGLGLLFPVGQYGIIPIGRRLLLQGVSLPVIISFLIAAPTINPVVLWLSWQTLSSQGQSSLFYWRVILSAIIAVIVGCLFGAYVSPKTSEVESPSDNALTINNSPSKSPDTQKVVYGGSSLLFPLPYQPLKELGKIIYDYKKTDRDSLSTPTQWKLFVENFSREFLEWGSLLILGCAIATLGQIFLPQGQILTLGTTPRWQIISLSLFGIIHSVGANHDSGIANTFISIFSGSSILSFLMFSSILDLKTLTFIFGSIRLKIALYFAIVTLQLIILSILLFDFYGTSLLL